MPALNRMTGPRGPRFYHDDGKLMFVHVLDGSTRFGPREATKEDAEYHPEAFAQYAASLDNPDLGDLPDKPVLTFVDPEGGPPAPAPKPYAERRAKAAS